MPTARGCSPVAEIRQLRIAVAMPRRRKRLQLHKYWSTQREYPADLHKAVLSWLPRCERSKGREVEREAKRGHLLLPTSPIFPAVEPTESAHALLPPVCSVSGACAGCRPPSSLAIRLLPSYLRRRCPKPSARPSVPAICDRPTKKGLALATPRFCRRSDPWSSLSRRPGLSHAPIDGDRAGDAGSDSLSPLLRFPHKLPAVAAS